MILRSFVLVKGRQRVLATLTKETHSTTLRHLGRLYTTESLQPSLDTVSVMDSATRLGALRDLMRKPENNLQA